MCVVEIYQQLSKYDFFFFIIEKIFEVNRKYVSLKVELEVYNEYLVKSFILGGFRYRRQNGVYVFFKDKEKQGIFYVRKYNDLKLVFSEFYFSFIFFQNYQNFNFIGFRKIFKKYDKVQRFYLFVFYQEYDISVEYFVEVCLRNICAFQSKCFYIDCFLYRQICVNILRNFWIYYVQFFMYYMKQNLLCIVMRN